MNHMFCDYYFLTSLNLSNFNSISVEDMNSTFCNCSSLISLNLSNFNTNNVKDMGRIFFGLNKTCKIISNDKKLINELK